MAGDNTIDTLQIKINADIDKAIDGFTNLETRLRSLSGGIGALSDTMGKLSTVAFSLRVMANVDPKNIERLGRALDKFKDAASISSDISSMASALAKLASVDVKTTGISSFTNSIGRLSKVKVDPQLPQDLTKISDAVRQFANIKDISGNVARLVSALAKLAASGSSIGTVTTTLPNFGKAIRDVATKLSQLGGVEPQIISFISVIAQLASAGKAMPEAAQNLGTLSTALRQFINSMANVNNVNQSVTALVDALARLSSSLGGFNASSSGGVSQSTNAMGKAFNSLLQILNKVASKILSIFKMVLEKVGTLATSIVSHISGIGRASNSMFTVADGIKSIIGGLLGMRGISGVFNWVKEAVTLGGNITEIDHIVETVFGEHMVGVVDDWANRAIDDFGIAAGAAKQYAGVLSSMFQASNIGMTTAGKMAMDLVGLAGDLSAFYNIDTQTAYEKIKSGMAGMVRPLRDLGIDLSVATLQEYALSQGITTSVSAMTQAEKVMLRYNYLMQVTGMQQGDFGRTSGRSRHAA